VKIIAHSVGNLKEARNALKKGVDFIEVDVSKRIFLPKFVVQHSAIKGILGVGPILASLFIPSVRDRLFLDLKRATFSLSFASKFAHLLSTFKVKGVRICGLNWPVISQLCEGNNLLPFYTLRTKEHVEKIKKILPFLKNPAGFSVHYSLIDKKFMEEFRNLPTSGQIWSWTVNDLTTVNQLAKLGVDGIITDDWEKLLTSNH